LKNMSQNGNLPQVGVKNKKCLSCHHVVCHNPPEKNKEIYKMYIEHMNES